MRMRQTHLVSIAQGMKWHVWRRDCREDGLSWLFKKGTHNQAVYKITKRSGVRQPWVQMPALLFITCVTWTRLLSRLSCRLSCHVETLPLSCVGVGTKCYGYVSLASDCNSHQTHSYPQPPHFILHISAWHPK